MRKSNIKVDEKLLEEKMNRDLLFEKKIAQEKQEEKSKLLVKFKSLKKIAKKFDFWETTLKTPYIKYLFFSSAYSKDLPSESAAMFGLSEFAIYPQANQFDEYCMIFSKQYLKYFADASIKVDFYNFDEFKTLFSNQDDISNKEMTVQNEILHINAWVKDKSVSQKINPANMIAHFSLLGYELSIEDNLQLVADRRLFDYVNLISFLNGGILAEHRKYLEKQLVTEKNTKPGKDKRGLSMKQKLLVLHFSGLLKDVRTIGPDIKQSLLLKAITDENDQNIRATLSKIDSLYYVKEKGSKPYVERDLEIVLKIFREIGNKHIEEEINKKLLELYK